MSTTGFLHPGAMGSAVAAACSGSRLWVSEGRSDASRSRADAVGLDDVGTIAALVGRADVVVSICPPDQALLVARHVADAGFDGVYLDANAISPDRAQEIAAIHDRFVDGGIVGPPPTEPDTTRLYLSGDDAPAIARLWDDSNLRTRVIEGGPGAASALKMAFAAWTKGTTALLLSIVAIAERYAVAGPLRDEWLESIPELVPRAEATAPRASLKAWRFAGEMGEIADTFGAAGLPEGFHRAAADIYARLSDFKGSAPPPDLDAVIAALLD